MRIKKQIVRGVKNGTITPGTGKEYGGERKKKTGQWRTVSQGGRSEKPVCANAKLHAKSKFMKKIEENRGDGLDNIPGQLEHVKESTSGGARTEWLHGRLRKVAGDLGGEANSG